MGFSSSGSWSISSSTVAGQLASAPSLRLGSGIVTGLTDEPADRLGTTRPEVPNAFGDFASRANTGASTLHSARRFASGALNARPQ